MPAMPLQDLISVTRNLLDDESPGDQFTDEELTRYFNQAQGYYDMFRYNHMARQLSKAQDLTADGSTELARLQPYLPRIVSIENTSDSPRTEIAPLEQGFHDRFRYLGTSLDPNVIGDYPSWYVHNNQIGILPIPSSGRTQRVWTMLRSPELHYGTAEDGAAKSLTLMASPTLGNIHGEDDAYNEINVMDVSTRQVNTITDYATSTRIATCAFTWASTPTSASVYSIMPTLDPEAHMLLCYYAIIHGNMRTDEPIAEIANERQRLETMLLANIRVEQGQRGRYVKRHNWE